ncbi:hypothetical protein OROGR_004424 [Orobanche gracilis]
MSGHSASACPEVRETNHQVTFPDCADISKTSEYENEVAEENKEVVCNGSENVPEEDDEDDDADFNPFLQENISVEVSSSLSSGVEDLDTDVADGLIKGHVESKPKRDLVDEGRDSKKETRHCVVATKQEKKKYIWSINVYVDKAVGAPSKRQSLEGSTSEMEGTQSPTFHIKGQTL